MARWPTRSLHRGVQPWRGQVSVLRAAGVAARRARGDLALEQRNIAVEILSGDREPAVSGGGRRTWNQ